MRSLETVQKSFKVFRIIAKVAKILCIVGASLGAVSALCAVIWYNGGHIFSLFGQPIEQFIEEDLLVVYVNMLAKTFVAVAAAVLFGLAENYLKHEQEDGTPFTRSGAERLRMLGIRCIYVPLIARAVSVAIACWQGVKKVDIADNLPSIIIGVALILVSLVFSYGADLENRDRVENPDGK